MRIMNQIHISILLLFNIIKNLNLLSSTTDKIHLYTFSESIIIIIMGKDIKRKSKTEKPPAIDLLLKPAIVVVIAFVAYYFLKGLNTEIPRIDVTDELLLREVFFSEGGEGKTYVGLCNTDSSTTTTTTTNKTQKPLPISSVFTDAMDEFQSSSSTSKSTKFVLIDCEATLPTSGKTIAKRFNLDLIKRPTIFVSGPKIENGPKQIPSNHLKTGHHLVKLLKSMLEPHAVKIESTKDLKSKCLNKSMCALLLKGGTPQQFLKDAFQNLVTTYEDVVTFASIDSKTLLVTNLEEFLPEYSNGVHRFVLFKKVSGGLEVGKDGKAADGRLITSISTLDNNESISYGSVSKLIDGVKSGSKQMKKLSTLPVVNTRSKKLEEQERKKRERNQNKSQEKKKTTTSSSSTSSSSFQENDGSKEGRKAERERRREEHRKNNPNYREKTPEEIAEMERKRRERMEEEAAKWNIGAEDAPSEGEYVDYEEEEEGYDDLDSDLNGEETFVEFVEEDEDDEDVIDLD